jgi:hypothetical protein
MLGGQREYLCICAARSCPSDDGSEGGALGVDGGGAAGGSVIEEMVGVHQRLRLQSLW